MVGPFVVFDIVMEWRVVIAAAAHVDDKVVVAMIFLKVVCDILYVVSISFFE